LGNQSVFRVWARFLVRVLLSTLFWDEGRY